MIAATTTKKGLKVRTAIDDTPYPNGVRVTDAELGTSQIAADTFHGEWNCVISPSPGKSM